MISGGWMSTELARLIWLGRASSREATESCLSRLRAVNPAINAVVRVLEEEALAGADAAAARERAGMAWGRYTAYRSGPRSTPTRRVARPITAS
jgi:Asp-tRNA(Asn)/Glu-tRNA(Gln) amidotransferase A subunit family amidase